MSVVSIGTDQKLREAVEGLYSTFKRYPLRPEMSGCSHCVPPEEDTILKSKPLRDLTPEDLSSFIWSAIYTYGDEEDLKHFLPRILEIMALGTDFFPGDEEIFTKRIHEAGWANWPESERAAVHDYLLAWWRHRLRAHPDTMPYISADDQLCSIAQLADDLGPFLDEWLERLSVSIFAKKLLTDLLRFEHALYEDDPASYFFWQERLEQLNQLRRWLSSPSVLTAFVREPQDDADIITPSQLPPADWYAMPAEEAVEALMRLQQKWRPA